MEATVEKAGAGQFGRRFKDVARCIGVRIRERRMMLGITQQELAEIAGVTYQQMHKYETSTNHIFAGRLHTLAQALGVDIDYFYQDMTAGSSTLEQPASRRMLLELSRNFLSIRTHAHREALCALTRALSNAPGTEELNQSNVRRFR